MTIDTALLAVILGFLVKLGLGINKLENTLIKQSVEIEYLKESQKCLEREVRYELKGVKRNDNCN